MKRSQGFAVFAALFILVVLSALGAFALNISSSQQTAAALDELGVRGYQAARAGIEWGMYKVQSTTAYNFSYGSPAGAPGTANANLRGCPTSPSSFAPGATSLSMFTVTVTCTATTDPHGGPTLYALQATACNQPLSGACPNTSSTAGTAPNALYVERRLTVSF